MKTPFVVAATCVAALACAASRAQEQPAACPPCALSPEPASTSPAQAEPARPADLASVKRELVRRINAGDAGGVFELYAPDMRAAFPLESVREFLGRVQASAGRISETETAGPTRKGVFEFDAERERVRLELSIDDQARITRLLLVPQKPRDPDPPIVRSEIALSLPFRGKWLVYRRHQEDYQDHSPFPSQRRAVDLVMVDAAGKSYRTDGKRNDDYYAWGADVLAAADGKVVVVVDGVPENEPKSKNGYMATGNLVILEHAPNLFSAYAHLRPGSIRVRVGVKVRRGQLLGLCGNSGNSTEPHLHFQLQDGPRFEQSWGIEAVFGEVAVTRGGMETIHKNYVFQRDDRVRAKL